MWRKLDQLARASPGSSRSVLPGSMLLMNLWIVELWLRRRHTRRQFCEQFLILLQQRKYDRNHLPCNTTNHLASGRVSARAVIKTTFDWNQAFVDLRPLA